MSSINLHVVYTIHTNHISTHRLQKSKNRQNNPHQFSPILNHGHCQRTSKTNKSPVRVSLTVVVVGPLTLPDVHRKHWCTSLAPAGCRLGGTEPMSDCRDSLSRPGSRQERPFCNCFRRCFSSFLLTCFWQKGAPIIRKV